MNKYIVKISGEFEVDADDEQGAESEAIDCFDFGSADVSIEEADDGGSTYIESLQHWIKYNPFDGDSNSDFLHSILVDKLEELNNAQI